MFDFHEKRKFRSIIYSKPVLVALFVIMLGFTYSVYGALGKARDTDTVKEQRAAVLDELNVREEVLRNEIERLNTARGVEAEIRSKFEVAKDGEEVVVIVEAPKDEPSPPPPEEKGFFRRLFGL